MDFLKKWTISIATTVIFITIVEMLLPSNTIKKYAKFVLGLILIVVILSPILTIFGKGINTEGITAMASTYFQSGKSGTKVDVKDQSLDTTLGAFKTNLETTITKDLGDKYSGLSFKVGTVIEYEETKKTINIKNISINYNDSTVKSINKVEINADKQKVETMDEKSKEIKEYVEEKYNVPLENISIYRGW